MYLNFGERQKQKLVNGLIATYDVFEFGKWYWGCVPVRRLIATYDVFE